MVSFEGTKRAQMSNVTYGIQGDVPASSSVIYIAGADIAIYVQDSVGSTRTQNCGREIESVAVSVVFTLLSVAPKIVMTN